MKRALDDAGSPLRTYFAEHLPNTKAVRERWKAASKGAELVVPGSGGPADLIGQASSLTITAAFDPTVPDPVVAGAGAAIRVGWVSEAAAADLLSDLEVALELRTPELFALAIVATWFEQIYRIGTHPAHPFAVLAGVGDAVELLKLVDPAWAAEVEALDDVAATALRPLHERPRFVAGGVLDGSADVGGADFDLLCGGTLIEIKATGKLALAQRDIQQLATYVLLDRSDRWGMREAGFYFARHGSLQVWTVDELLELLAGGPVDVATLRSSLTEHLGRP